MARQLKLSYIIEATEGASARVLDGIGSKLDAIGRSYAGLAAMVGGGLEIKASIDSDSYFHQLAALTDTSLEHIDKIKHGILAVASDVKVNSDELIHGMAAFRAGGGSFDEFTKSTHSAADAVAVLGGQGEEVGRIMAAMERSFDLRGPEKLSKGLALVTEQLGMVNGDVTDFAKNLPDLAERYAALGYGDEQAMRELGATYMTLSQTSRSPRQTYGTISGLLDMMMTEPGRQGFTAKTGIQTEDSAGNALPFADILRSIGEASKERGRRWQLESAGLPEPVLQALQKLNTPEGQRTYQSLLAAKDDPAELERKALLATSGIGGTATKWHEEIKSDADGIVEFMDKFAPELDSVAKAGAGVLTVLGGVSAAGGVVSGLKTLGGALGLLGLSADKAAASIDKEAAADATRRGGVGGGKAALIGKSMIYGWAANEAAAALDPNDALGDWVDNNIPGASWLDNFASHLGLGRDYAEQRRVAKALHPDREIEGVPGVPDIHAAEDRPLDASRYLPRGMHMPGAGAFGATDRVRQVARYFTEHGLAADQASGVAAGAFAESGLDPDIVNPKSGAYGIGQWLGSRKAALFRRYGSHPSLPQQLDFMDWELHGGDTGGAAVLGAHSATGALDAYIRRFMRPAPGSETLGDLARGRNMLARVGGEIVIRVEAADGTKARIASVKSSNPDLALTYAMGVGMAAP